MSIRNVSVLTTLALLLSLGTVSLADKPDSGKKPATQPAYPLTVCVVSDEDLGSMGDPVVIKYSGHDVKFCCAHCEDEFRENPSKYLKKLDDASKAPATQPATQPATPDTGGQKHAHRH